MGEDHTDDSSDEGEFPASVLTPAQRRYLARENGGAEYPNGEEPSPAAKRAMRTRIRERLQTALLDFSHILEYADPDDISESFTPLDEFKEETVIDRVGSAVPGVIGVLYLGGLETEMKGVEVGQNEGWHFEGTVEAGIERALNRVGVSVRNVSVNIDIDRGEDLDDLAEGDLSELSPRELRQLLLAEKITSEELGQAME